MAAGKSRFGKENGGDVKKSLTSRKGGGKRITERGEAI